MSEAKPKPKLIPLASLLLDGDTQARVCGLDREHVARLVDALKAGEKLDPIKAFATKDKTGRYYIGDGWHTQAAYQAVGKKKVPAVVAPGGKLAAIKCAAGANHAHGLPRTNADKRRAVELMLKNYPKMSDRSIAKACHVTHPFVAKLREATGNVTSSREGADGKTRKTPTPQPPEQTNFFKQLDKQWEDANHSIKTMLEPTRWNNKAVPLKERVTYLENLDKQLVKRRDEIKQRLTALSNERNAA